MFKLTLEMTYFYQAMAHGSFRLNPVKWLVVIWINFNLFASSIINFNPFCKLKVEINRNKQIENLIDSWTKYR